jgi:hypothetical protein
MHVKRSSDQWAKVQALVEGAELASNELWGKRVTRVPEIATSDV